MLSRPGSRRHFDVVDPSEGSALATGDGLNAKDAQRLSTALDRARGRGASRSTCGQLHNAAGAVDRQPCPLCGGTGLRRDEVGVRYGYARRDTSGAGGCNGCQGLGTTLPFHAQVCFSREHVEEFAGFLHESGGFQIL